MAAEHGDPVSDDDLIARATAGEGGAWGVLVDRHLARLVAFAWYRLGDAAEAEDVAQETILRLLAKAPDWRADGPAVLRTWLYRVATNLCIDRRRAARPTEPFEDARAVDVRAAAVIDLPATTDARIDARRSVRRALAALPQRQQTAIILVHYQELTVREAAAVLEISEHAAESLIARAPDTPAHPRARPRRPFGSRLMSDDPIHVGAPTLSLDRFGAIVESHGAAPSRWPAEQRAAMQALAAASAEARALLEDEAALDVRLDSLAAPPPSDLLVARLKSPRMRAAALAPGHRLRRNPIAAAVALLAVLGVALSLWLDEGSGHAGRVATVDPIAEVMLADLALVDADAPAETLASEFETDTDPEEPDSAFGVAGLALE